MYEEEVAWAKNPRMRSVSEKFYDDDIGGALKKITVESSVLCEVARPCVAQFHFYHNELLRHGITVSLDIGPLDIEDSRKATYSNPYLMFGAEKREAQQILSTLKFIE